MELGPLERKSELPAKQKLVKMMGLIVEDDATWLWPNPGEVGDASQGLIAAGASALGPGARGT